MSKLPTNVIVLMYWSERQKYGFPNYFVLTTELFVKIRISLEIPIQTRSFQI
jgi:hypothetical protein